MWEFVLGLLGAGVTQMRILYGAHVVQSRARHFRFNAPLFWTHFSLECLAGGVLAVLLKASIRGNEYLAAFAVGLCYQQIMNGLSAGFGDAPNDQASKMIKLSHLTDDDTPDDPQVKELWGEFKTYRRKRAIIRYPLSHWQYLKLWFIRESRLP